MRHNSFATLVIFLMAISSSMLAPIAATAATDQSSASDDEIAKELGRADANRSKTLDETELVLYFLNTDPQIKQLRAEDRTEDLLKKRAESLASDALTFRPHKKGTAEISLEEAEDYVLRRAYLLARHEQAAQPLSEILWPTLRFRRFWIDSVDPGKDKYRQLRPFQFSYSHDSKRDGSDNSVVVLGDVTLVEQHLPFSDEARDVLVAPSLGFDVDSAKKDPTDSSMSAGVRAQLRQALQNDWLSDFALAVTPKYITDRRFHADIWEVTGAISGSSKYLHAGYLSWIGGAQKDPDDVWIKVYWVPELRLEFGDVTDSAHSKRLKAIEDSGAYTRVVPHLTVSVEPTVLSDRLAFKGDYFYRIDTTQGWEKDYLELGAQFDLVKSFLSLTIVYRNGNKPPSFDRTNAIVFGIGIQR